MNMSVSVNQDLQDILHLHSIVHSQSDLANMRRNLLRALQEVFHINSATFCLANRRLIKMVPAKSLTVNIPESYSERYIEYYHRYDPFLLSESKQIVYCSSSILPYRSELDFKFYNEFLIPQNIHHRLVICFRSGSDLLGRIDIHRPKELPPFSSMDLAKARILADYVTVALNNLILINKIKQDNEISMKVSNFSLLGILILDWTLKPSYHNSMAREICLSLYKQRPKAKVIVDDGLIIPSEVLADCLTIKKLVHTQDAVTVSKYDRIFYINENTKICVNTSLLNLSVSGKPVPHFLLFIEKFIEDSRTIKEALITKYRFTKRELEIAMFVCMGLTNEEISRKLCISQFTVANHIKKIFEKAGVKNRTKLTRLMQNDKLC